MMKLFPPGSVVSVKGYEQELMIISVNPSVEKIEYGAVIFQDGYDKEDGIISFSDSDIESIQFYGYLSKDKADEFKKIYESKMVI